MPTSGTQDSGVSKNSGVTHPVEPTPPAELVIDMAQSKTNLNNLVRRRVSGELTDSEFYTYCRQYCVGLEEHEWVQALDECFELAPAPWTPDDGPAPDDRMEDQEVINLPRTMTAGDFKNGKTPGLIEDLSPGDMIDDYIVDDTTGAIVPDGK